MSKEVHAVVRTDLMDGTGQGPALVSVRFYSDPETYETPADVDNGVIVNVSAGLEDGQREIYKGKAAKTGDDLDDLVVLASPEICYDQRDRNLHDFYNEAGSPARGYRLQHRNIFSVTKEGFDGAVPTVGQTIGLGENGKLKSEGTDIGKCIHIETKGPYTYYAIQVIKPKAGA